MTEPIGAVNVSQVLAAMDMLRQRRAEDAARKEREEAREAAKRAGRAELIGTIAGGAAGAYFGGAPGALAGASLGRAGGSLYASETGGTPNPQASADLIQAGLGAYNLYSQESQAAADRRAAQGYIASLQTQPGTASPQAYGPAGPQPNDPLQAAMGPSEAQTGYIQRQDQIAPEDPRIAALKESIATSRDPMRTVQLTAGLQSLFARPAQGGAAPTIQTAEGVKQWNPRTQLYDIPAGSLPPRAGSDVSDKPVAIYQDQKQVATASNYTAGSQEVLKLKKEFPKSTFSMSFLPTGAPQEKSGEAQSDVGKLLADLEKQESGKERDAIWGRIEALNRANTSKASENNPVRILDLKSKSVVPGGEYITSEAALRTRLSTIGGNIMVQPINQALPSGFTGGENEPLVQVEDPNDPTRSIYVLRSQARGLRTAQGTRTPNNVKLPDGRFVNSPDGRTYIDPADGKKRDLPSDAVIVGEDTVIEAQRLSQQSAQAQAELGALKAGKPVPLPPNAESATEATPAQPATGMFAAAEKGSGPASNLKAVANAVIGGAADLAGMQINFFPDNAVHRQQLELFNQEIVRAISNNPRYPVAEVNRIRERITVDPKTFWVNPQDASRKMLGIRGFLEDTRRVNLEQMASGTLTTQEMNAYRSNNAEINRLLGFMGSPGRQTPHPSIVTETKEAISGQQKNRERIDALLQTDTSKMTAEEFKAHNDELEQLLR